MDVEKLINELHIYQFKTKTRWKDIAEYVGVSPTTIHLFKEGRREMAVDKLLKVAELIKKY